MADVVDAATRSRMMSGIRGKNTKPEMLVRRGLHRRGFRFRLHERNLPGKPDLTFPRYKATVFVHGCFWHGHACPVFRWPASRPEFWHAKIGRNQSNDKQHREKLLASGWRVCIVWECALRKPEMDREDCLNRLADWLCGESGFLEIVG
jgi:DNA mismatch endonuclease, patch repair protein